MANAAAAIARIVEDAQEFVAPTAALRGTARPRLLVENTSPDRTVAALRDILVQTGLLFDRGVPVRIVSDRTHGGMVAHVMTTDGIVLMAHEVRRPYALRVKADGSTEEVDARLPKSLAAMYLDWRGEWRLPPLNGVTSTPLLGEDGTIRSAEGYDPDSGMWCENVPDVAHLVPERPTIKDAAAGLRRIREAFRTFCFADADMRQVVDGVPLVDIDQLPGHDESAFLAALLTAACRPSLPLAPGVLVRAAPMSGAGAGKGLLARCISLIATGREPHAVTAGGGAEELEKRIGAELIAGGATLFLDNLNGTTLKSDTLASAITERSARVRRLGRSEMVPVNASAFIIITGNGLAVTEDLARRFISIDLDPRMEDPESRPFRGDIRREVIERRTELLAAALTIWRWGRATTNLARGKPLGSFEVWCRWVRDPLLALGCRDPAERVSEAKQRDARRQEIGELFQTWWSVHEDRPVTANQLNDDVKRVLDVQDRGRQFIASRLEKLSGTRMAGYVLTRQAPAGKWGAATYALLKTDSREEHRDHRGRSGFDDVGTRDGSQDAPYAPYAAADRPRETLAQSINNDQSAQFDERASIREFDGGLSRAAAEAGALTDLSAPKANPPCQTAHTDARPRANGRGTPTDDKRQTSV